MPKTSRLKRFRLNIKHPKSLILKLVNAFVLAIYQLGWWLVLPLVLLRLLTLKNPAYRQNIRQRLGSYSALKLLKSSFNEGSWWLHGVSVGENIAAASLVKLWLQQPSRPPIVISCMTPTGLAQIKQLYGDEVVALYLPYDIPCLLKKFFNFFKPRLLVIMETELWPQLINVANKRHVPLFIVNGRLSDSSFVKYSYIKPIMRFWLNRFKLIMVQSKLDYEKFIKLGVNKTRLVMAGNLKFDLTISPIQQQQAESLRHLLMSPDERKIWVAASLHEGEAKIVLEAAKLLWQKFPTVLLIVAPRHPENFSRMHDFFAKALGANCVTYYSELNHYSIKTKVLIADVMGRLMALYGASDIALIGGSLIAHGGHNLLEPAAWQKPVISGVYLNNFIEIRNKLLASCGLTLVKDARELASVISQFILEPNLAKEKGQNAFGVVMANQGATLKVLNQIKAFM